jgi:AcrR family transcriptional regulator
VKGEAVSRGRFAGAVGHDSRPRGRDEAIAPEGRRTQILQAAADVICERGFGETRVAQVADRAGVSGATVIYHFATLDRLLVEALRHCEQLFYNSAERIVAEGTTPKDRLTRLVRWVFAAEHNPQLWALWLETWSQAPRHPQVAEARAQQDTRWRSMIAGIVAELPFDDASGAWRFAVSFGALLDGLAIQVALHDNDVSPGAASDIAMSYANTALGW